MRKILIAIRGRNGGCGLTYTQMVEPSENKTNTLTSIAKDNMVLELYAR